MSLSKILFYSPHPNLNFSSPSGYGTHMREMVKGFENHNYQVDKFVAGGDELQTLDIQISQSGLKLLARKVIPGLIWRTLKARTFVQTDKVNFNKLTNDFTDTYAFMYERYFYGMESGINFAKKRSIPHVYEVNAPYLEEYIDMDGGTNLLHERACKAQQRSFEQSDLIVVVSNKLKEHFMKQHQLPESKILVLPNAINLAAFDGNSETGNLKEQLAIRDELVIGFVGSIFPYHGVDILLKAFAKINQKNKSLKLLIVGDGESLKDLKELAQNLKIEDQVIFTGNVNHDEVKDYIAMMDIAVMAKSNWYGSPVKIFEYGVMNKSIIAPNNGPVTDVMTNKVDGLLIDQTESELVNALNLLIQDKDLRDKIASNFSNKVRSKHTWDNNVKILLDRLKSVLN